MDVVQNDYGYDMTFSITNSDGDAMDLTPLTLTLLLRNVDTEEKIEKALTITDAEGGVCKYTVEDGTFKYANTFSYQIEVNSVTSKTTILGTENICVQEKIWDCSSL